MQAYTRTDKSWNDSDSIRGEGAHILQGAQIGAGGGAEPLWPPHFNHYISLRGLRGRCKLPQQGPLTRTGLIILTRHKNRSTFGRCHGRLTCFCSFCCFSWLTASHGVDWSSEGTNFLHWHSPSRHLANTVEHGLILLFVLFRAFVLFIAHKHYFFSGITT